MRQIIKHGVYPLIFLILFHAGILFAQQNIPQPLLTSAELEQLVAPVALYPDTLLAEVLMASTYPLEVVQAARWLEKNNNLKGEQLYQAAQTQDWDESIKSIVEFPDVVSMMNENLDWTTKLGDAFLAQQNEVMDAIQVLRQRAEAAGNLKTNKEQVVVQDGQTIAIQPADPQVVYVPTYNPAVVYGTWYYPAYPPYTVYPPGYPVSDFVSFGLGVAVGAVFASFDWNGNNCCYWGGGGHWHGNTNVNINNINVNRGNFENRRWEHNPEHRRGVEYGNRNVAERYQRSNQAASHREFRGYGEGGRPTTASIEKGLQQRERGGNGAFNGYNRGQSTGQHGQIGQGSRNAVSSNRANTERRNTGAAQSRQGEFARNGENRSAAPRAPSYDAFNGYASRGNARANSQRGKTSRQSYQRSMGSRNAGGGSRASAGRGGGGGGRGGGGRR